MLLMKDGVTVEVEQQGHADALMQYGWVPAAAPAAAPAPVKKTGAKKKG